MTENQRLETNEKHQTQGKIKNNAVVLRVPKPSLQIIVLGFIALITLFQTFQLVRISSSASSTSVKATSPASTTTDSGQGGTGSNADVPQSMVGGC